MKICLMQATFFQENPKIVTEIQKKRKKTSHSMLSQTGDARFPGPSKMETAKNQDGDPGWVNG